MSIFTYTAESQNFLVQVSPEYVGENDLYHGRIFIYHYTITIKNLGPETCQLLRRHWIIRNGLGEEEHIQGDGVVGQQPFIAPGESYTYTSGCPMPTPTGNMRGAYRMQRPDRSQFDIEIPLFFLRPPHIPIHERTANA